MIKKLKTLIIENWREFKKNWIIDYSPEAKQERLELLNDYHKAIKRITDEIKDAKYLYELQLIEYDIIHFEHKFHRYSFEGFADMVELLEKDRCNRIIEIEKIPTI